jgi:ATP-dependent DNA helicase DinG
MPDQDLATLLGPEGPLAKVIPGFAPRRQQQEMAEAVAAALDHNGVLIAEAGTGTGKTFAYLVPALLSGKKVIVSTGTKNLQDQLFRKDLPLVRQALGVPVEAALLKGRANYLCLHRLEIARAEGRFGSREQAHQFQQVARWAEQTASGDIAELTTLPEDSPLWPLVTSSADNCLGGECPRLDDCFLAHARRQAQEADLVVVNHHLFFADMALRDGGFGELLPGANAFILDEAHQLPETASSFFGTTLGGNQLRELAQDTIAEDLREAGESPQLRKAAEALEKSVQELRLAFGVETRRGTWREVAGNSAVQEAVAQTTACLAELAEKLEPLAQRGKGLDSCRRRAEELRQTFALVTGPSPEGYIHWFETHTRSVTFNLTPLEISDTFAQKVTAAPRTWILTSATLAVGESFTHFASQLGLEEAETRQWGSPFEYEKQALFYVPTEMPDPASPDYTRRVIEVALPVLEASDGRAFLLFTSHRALQEAARLLEGRLPWPLLVQGDAPRSRLLERFRAEGNAVLLGTGSFWEGVDVRGEALSCVIIDKLPFSSPGDPVLQARIEAMRERGENPFMDFQLPQAVITLKQGAGRLIRDVSDRGVLVVCDPRLISKPYGRLFVESLPRMLRTRSLDVVRRFFALEKSG